MLEIRDLVFKAKGDSDKLIIDHVSLNVHDGEFVVITGPNGSGKSSLAKAIMGIIKVSQGQILLDKEDITHLSITERARKGLAFSWQQPVRFKGIRICDLLSIANGAVLSRDEAGKYLEMVGLEPRLYLLREINHRLSGGELKRIEIASVLARNANLMIFDEPEAGIDLWSFDNLTRVFRKLKTAKKTIIVISHQERILKVADRIVVLNRGKIREIGSPEKILPIIVGAKHETK